ncbi:MAG TPA: matrixin family metalloprotease [Thermoanaerobaculia bacterium]|nr:matrixin family metalloprotease [Thermoanaerobaculia bacterium]
MNAFRRFALLALVTAAAVAVATPAHAYRMIQNTSVGRVTAGAAVTCSASGGFVHWSIRNINWYHNTANQGSGKSTALTNAMNAWTNVTSADHVLNYAGTTTAGFVTDGRNTVNWTTGAGCSGSCLALTALVLQSGQVVVETDVTFNNSVTWTTNGANYDTQAVAAHEFGHALGIHHTELTGTPRPTMYASYFGSDGRTLETDDKSALQCAESRY